MYKVWFGHYQVRRKEGNWQTHIAAIIVVAGKLYNLNLNWHRELHRVHDIVWTKIDSIFTLQWVKMKVKKHAN